ncbi:MAG: hypothetical protein CL808_08695, partial [Citromicrobium sp.]|nr:hypothetical protein [Citromicrobium sp.]
MRISVGIAAVIALLAGGCGEASADETSGSAAEASSADVAEGEAAEPAPLRGPDLSGLFDANEEHVLAPLTMEARLLLNYSFETNGEDTALVSTGPRGGSTTGKNGHPPGLRAGGGGG